MLARSRSIRAAALLVAAHASPGRGASFELLGQIFGGELGSGAYGITSDGSTVVGVGRSGGVQQPFRWTRDTGMIGLGLPPGASSAVALGVSDDGSRVVGFDAPSSEPRAFQWTASGGFTTLGTLPGGVEWGIAYDISADGSTIVGLAHGVAQAQMQAYRWTASTGMVEIGFGRGTNGVAVAVSADGTVVVGQGNQPFSRAPSQAFRWTSSSGAVSLGALPGGTLDASSSAVSPDGAVVVGDAAIGRRREAFRWTAATGMVGLGFLPGFESTHATAVSSDGNAIVGYARTGLGPYGAFLWDPVHGMRLLEEVLTAEYGLDLGGWSIGHPGGMTPDGRIIVGTAFDAEHHTQAFLVTIPEPGTAALLLMGLAGLASWRGTSRGDRDGR